MERKYILVAGYAQPGEEAEKLYYAHAGCGDIEDGIGFDHGNEGGWVVRLEDMEQVCREVRESIHGNENVTTELTDEEISLVIQGLYAIDHVEPGASDLIKKLGIQ